MPLPLILINVLSIDAVAVAVLWQAAVTRLWTGRNPTVWESVAMGLATWIVYTIDRILDGSGRPPRRPPLATDRHRFHRRYRMALIVAVCLAATSLSLISAGRLRGTIVSIALTSGGLIVVYLIWRKRFPDEGSRVFRTAMVGVMVAVGTHILTLDAVIRQETRLSVFEWWTGLLGLSWAVMINCRGVQRLKLATRWRASTTPGEHWQQSHTTFMSAWMLWTFCQSTHGVPVRWFAAVVAVMVTSTLMVQCRVDRWRSRGGRLKATSKTLLSSGYDVILMLGAAAMLCVT